MCAGTGTGGRRPAPFGAAETLAVIVLPYPLVLLTALAIFGHLPAPAEREAKVWLLALLQAPAQLLVFATACLLLARGGDPRAFAALGWRSGFWSGFGRGLLWYLPFGAAWWLLTRLYVVLLQRLGLELPLQPILGVFAAGRTPDWALPLLVAEVACIGPLFEEFAFRGFLFGWLEGRSGAVTATFLSSAVWGLLHGDLLLVPPLFVLGLVLCWLRVRRGLWAAFGLHAAHNAFVVAAVVGGLTPTGSGG